MRFIYLQPGRATPTGILLGLVSLALAVALFIFFLPVLAGIFVLVIAAGLGLWLWNWFRMKTGTESEEVRAFREAMAQADAAARRHYGAAPGTDDGVCPEDPTHERPARIRRRRMDDVSDAQEIL